MDTNLNLGNGTPSTGIREFRPPLSWPPRRRDRWTGRAVHFASGTSRRHPLALPAHGPWPLPSLRASVLAQSITRHAAFFLSGRERDGPDGYPQFLPSVSLFLGCDQIRNIWRKYSCSTFVVILQNLFNHELIRFKRFVSTFTDKRFVSTFTDKIYLKD
jgi:hypothetical protein